jgi:hypothetical protein
MQSDACEDLAQVDLAATASRALLAGLDRADRDSVTVPGSGHARPHLDDCSGELVTLPGPAPDGAGKSSTRTVAFRVPHGGFHASSTGA